MRRFCSEKGATAVEYSLGIALLVIVCIGGLQALERNAGDTLDHRASVGGNPDSGTSGSTGGSSGGTTGGATGGSTGGGGGGSVTVDSIQGSFVDNPPGSKWKAIVTVRLVDASGNPLSGVTNVRGNWTPGDTAAQCLAPTDADGRCAVELGGINKNPTSNRTITFTLTAVGDGTTHTWEPGGGQPSSATVTCGSPVC